MPYGWAAAEPLDQSFAVRGDLVGVEAGPAQEFEDVGGAEGSARDFAVAADPAPALLVGRVV
ncbi:hypothetical protein ACIPY6_34325 [Streptomyces sp. NPDC090054]|uniref:hypothetical protein n=1 Tax=Streptomyces sp. NPDC090054 TaxID=3365933 RepID=UPI00382E313D